MDEKIKIWNVTDEKIELWSLEKILEEINRDHSDEYTPYDENDWRKGWYEWVEQGGEEDFYKLLDKAEKEVCNG